MTKILLTGGGSGGHVYPLLAVSDTLKSIGGEIVDIVYMGPSSPLNQEFASRGIPVKTIMGSKVRRYASIQNVLDIPKFFLSIFQAIFKMYFIMPDVVFSKGGTGALPVILAARFYFIPVLIHESDSVPGLTNRLSGKFAKRIGISFPEAIDYFDARKVALVGNPVRAELFQNPIDQKEAKTQLGFSPDMPLVFVVGGSLGAVRVNEFIISCLKELLEKYQVLHQVGLLNIEDATNSSKLILKEISPSLQSRYKLEGFLNIEKQKLAFAAADVVISRAGAGGIFETATFGKPAILIPLNGSANDHQKVNAYEYAKSGAGVVLEEENMTVHLLLMELKDILEKPEIYARMNAAAKNFAKPHAAETLAREILNLGGSAS